MDFIQAPEDNQFQQTVILEASDIFNTAFLIWNYEKSMESRNTSIDTPENKANQGYRAQMTEENLRGSLQISKRDSRSCDKDVRQ